MKVYQTSGDVLIFHVDSPSITTILMATIHQKAKILGGLFEILSLCQEDHLLTPNDK